MGALTWGLFAGLTVNLVPSVQSSRLSDSQQAILRPDPLSPTPYTGSVDPALFTVLEEISRVADIAYCVGPASTISTPFACSSRCADFPSFELIKTFSASLPLPLVDESATGYLAYDHNPTNPRIILAFRGTYSLADAVADLATTPQPYSSYPCDNPDATPNTTTTIPTSTDCLNCTVHSGFHASYLATRPALLPALTDALHQHPTYRLAVAGHSLGGAIATLFALELRARGLDLSLTTFGAPRIGNAPFAYHIGARLDGDVRERVGGETVQLPRLRRVTHVGDPVPGLPWEEWGYAQSEGEVYIAKADLPVRLDDVRMCEGAHDAECSAPLPVEGGDGTGQKAVQKRWEVWRGLKPWEYISAHRDYFHRLGLCIKSDYSWETGDSRSKV